MWKSKHIVHIYLITINMKKLKTLIGFIERQERVYAKTYSDTFPHEYIAKKKLDTNEDKDLFTELAREIKEKGYKEKFGKITYQYLVIWEWKYRASRMSPESEYIINRVINEE